MLLLNRISTRIVLAATTIPVLAAALATAPLHAQQPAAVSQLGTVKSVAADTVVITKLATVFDTKDDEASAIASF